MEAPPVQYVRTSDGYDIAYGVSGSGRPIVVLSFPFEHVQLAWQHPDLGDWLRALAARFRVVQLDTRGSGLSTRSLGPDFVFDHFQRDLEAVIDHLELDRVIVWGVSTGGATAARYAIENPHRVTAMVTVSPIRARARAFWADLPEQDWETFLYSVAPRDTSPEESKKRVELLKQAYDREDFVRRAKAAIAIGNVQGIWERLTTPTLLLHAKDYALFDVADSIEVAWAARASLTLLDGSSVFGNAEQGIQAIEDFLAQLPADPPTPESAGALSSRELEVLRLIAAGRSNQEIAEALVISINTVRRHVSNILDKTGAANRAQAVAYARDHALA